tara:strand:+ start:139 stop:411 length:273 start_codon:yes stop_codon:yes gene_type:complete
MTIYKSFIKAKKGRDERYSKPVQLEFKFRDYFNADAAGTLDDPNHDWELGCTEDPSTCENLVICLCEEEANRLNRLKRVNQEGGKNEKSN